MSTRPHDQRQRLFGRRQFLGLSGAAGAGLLMARVPGRTLAAKPRRPSGLGKQGVTALAAGGPYQPHPPYSLAAECTLSEDHFLVKTGKIDPGTDRAAAYSRSDGEAEAVLLQGSTVSQVYRDPAAAGGWNIRAIASGATDMVAGMAADSGTGGLSLHVFYRTSSGKITHAREQSDGTFIVVETLDWGSEVSGALQVTTDVARNLLVFCLQPAAGQDSYDAKLGFYWTGRGYLDSSPSAGVLTKIDLWSANPQFPVGGSAVVSYAELAFGGDPTLMVYTPATETFGISVYSYRLQPGEMNVHADAPRFVHQPPDWDTGNDGIPLSVDYLSSPGAAYLPTAVIRTVDEDLYVLTHDYNENVWLLQQLTLPNGDGKIQWQPSNISLGDNIIVTNNLLNLFVVRGSALSVVRQFDRGNAKENAVNPIFNPAVPLQGGVAAAVSQARPSSGDELIVIASDGNLEVLSKTLDGSWAGAEIQLPSTEPAQVSTYRVQLVLMDGWSSPVYGRDLQITAAAPAFALVDGRGVILSSQPVTFTTGFGGEITLAIAAEGLFAPQLTVSGGGLPGPVTVSPSKPVNDYMTGAATLNLLPAMAGSTLAAAATPAGNPVYPLARNNSDIAAAAATLITGAASAAANPTITTLTAPGRAASGGGHHGRPQPHEGITLGSAPAKPGQVKVAGVALSLQDLIDDALYAIKTGLAKVSHVALVWDATLQRWVAQITAEFDAWAEQIVRVTIEGLQDAASIFHSVFNHLEAVLGDVINWLEVHVLALLRDAVTLAGTYELWTSKMATELSAICLQAKGDLDGFLHGLSGTIKHYLAELDQALGATPIDQLGGGGHTADLILGDSHVPALTGSPGSGWFEQKVTQSNLADTGIPAPGGELQDIVQKLIDTLKQEGADFEQAAEDFRIAVTGLVTNPKEFGGVALGHVLDAIGNIIDAGLALADLVADVVIDLVVAAVLAFQQLLETTLEPAPLLDQLLQAAGLDRPLTIGGLVSLTAAFPTVLAYKLIKFDAAAVPFAGLTTGELHTDSDSVGFDLSVCSLVAIGLIGGIDCILSIATGVTADEPPKFLTWADAVMPLLIGALTIPFPENQIPFTTPPDLSGEVGRLKGAAWIGGLSPGIWAAISLIAEIHFKPIAQPATNAMLVVTTLSGVMTGGTASAGDILGASSPADGALLAASDILLNTGGMLAWCLTQPVLGATDGASAIAQAIIQILCTTAGIICAAWDL